MLGGQQWRRRPNRRRSQRRRRRLRKGLLSARRDKPSSTSVFEADVTRAGEVEGLAQRNRLRPSPAQSTTEGRRRDRSLSFTEGSAPSGRFGGGGAGGFCFSRSEAGIAADWFRSPDLADALTSAPQARRSMSARKASHIIPLV